MSPQKAKESINKLQNLCREAVDIANTASRHSKSLSGNNFYGNKFHQQIVNISSLEFGLKKFLTSCLEENEFETFCELLNSLKSTSTIKKQRVKSLKDFILYCQTTVIPKIEETNIISTPKTEQVLPFAVVQGTRTYLERMITQANGCYEHGWYDACSVMVRKFAETLIIEVYEEKKEAHEIKDSDNNFFMLEKLINHILTKTSWGLQRETKKFLPEIKKLGDRAAHNRRWECKKDDIDKILSGLRVIADDLLHLANLK
jgi:hypothetical protein